MAALAVYIRESDRAMAYPAIFPVKDLFHAVWFSTLSDGEQLRVTQLATAPLIVQAVRKNDLGHILLLGFEIQFARFLPMVKALGADPTVRFILRKYREPLTKSDLKTNSRYNTRRFTGLPPGPICSPGRAAIQATLFPAPTDALYFVAKDDGSRAHWFNRTFREHNRDKKRAAKNRRARGKS